MQPGSILIYFYKFKRNCNCIIEISLKNIIHFTCIAYALFIYRSKNKWDNLSYVKTYC